MKLIVKIITGPGLVKPASERAKAARMTELSNVLHSVASTIANCGAKDGQIEHGDFRGSFWIEG
jgi:hypothetical protein